MECGKRRSIKAHVHMVYLVHLSSYKKFLVCGAVSLGYCQGGMGSGDWSTPLPGVRTNS